MTQEKIDWQVRIGFQHVVRRGPFVVVSGTGPLAEDGRLTAPGDPYRQAQRCLERIGNALESVGADLSHVVRTHIVLADPSHWEEVGRAHGEVFRDVQPATMMVGGTLLDPGYLVEIEATAWVSEGAA
jgi:enamine deaminase RidA (YjgF/YER057c/UK114 family)